MEQIDAANLVAVSVSIALAAGIPALFPRLPLPGAVVEIVIGALMGPHILGLIHPGVVLDALARFGQWMLFLMAGFEMDPAVLHGRPLRNALAGWTLTAAIALAAALLLSSLAVVRAPAFTAAAMSTTAIGTLMPGLRDAGALGPPYGPMVLAAGAIGEAGPVMALSLVTAGGRASHEALLMLAFVAGAIAVIRAAGRASGGRFSRIVGRTMGTSGQFLVAISSIAVHRGFMPAAQGTALVGGGILTVLLFPALARPFLSEGEQEGGGEGEGTEPQGRGS